MNPNLAPSQSTVVSAAIGIPLGIIVVWVLGTFLHVSVPGEVGSAIGSVLSTMIGLFGNGGRARDVA